MKTAHCQLTYNYFEFLQNYQGKKIILGPSVHVYLIQGFVTDALEYISRLRRIKRGEIIPWAHLNYTFKRDLVASSMGAKK